MRLWKTSSFWVLAGTSSILLHLFLWVWVPRKMAHESKPLVRLEGPEVVFDEGISEAELLHTSPRNVTALWSPALFALPSPLGFSRRVWVSHQAGKPPENPPVEFAHLLNRADGSSVTEWNASDYAGIQTAMNTPLLEPQTSEKTIQAPDTNAYLFMYWEGSFGGKDPERIHVRGDEGWTDDKPWDAKVYVNINRQGAVQNAFLEKPTSSKIRDEKLIQWLRGLRTSTRLQEQTGWLELRFLPGSSMDKADQHD